MKPYPTWKFVLLALVALVAWLMRGRLAGVPAAGAGAHGERAAASASVPGE